MLVSCPTPQPTPSTLPRELAPHIEKLHLHAFRNHKNLSLECHNSTLVLIGPNGAGKTSLLEALSLLGSGKGLQNAQKNEWEHRPSEIQNTKPTPPLPLPLPWAVQGHIRHKHASSRITTCLQGQKRVLLVNGEPIKLNELSHQFALFWLTPPMDNFLRETPHNLRRFLDNLIARFEPDHARRVARTLALQRHYHALQNQNSDKLWRHTVLEHFSQAVISLAASRIGFIRRFNRMASVLLPSLPPVHLQLNGLIASHLSQFGASSAEEYTLQILSKNLPSPHTHLPQDKLSVSHAENPNTPAALLSSGERKILLISTILTVVRLWIADRGFAPVLLLDDITSHLDKHVKRALWEALLHLQLQAWISGQEPSDFQDLQDTAAFFSINPSLAKPFKP